MLRIGDVLWIGPQVPRFPDHHAEFPLRVVRLSGHSADGRIHVDGIRLHVDTSANLEPVQVLVAADHPHAGRRWCPPMAPVPRRLPVADSVLPADTPPSYHTPPAGYTRVYPPPA